MAWNLIDFAALGAAELGKWQQVRAADPALDSPFFHPAFAGAVHALFGNVQVAINDEHQVWFPVQVSNGVARPAGPGADFRARLQPLVCASTPSTWCEGRACAP